MTQIYDFVSAQKNKSSLADPDNLTVVPEYNIGNTVLLAGLQWQIDCFRDIGRDIFLKKIDSQVTAPDVLLIDRLLTILENTTQGYVEPFSGIFLKLYRFTSRQGDYFLELTDRVINPGIEKSAPEFTLCVYTNELDNVNDVDARRATLFDCDKIHIAPTESGRRFPDSLRKLMRSMSQMVKDNAGFTAFAEEYSTFTAFIPFSPKSCFLITLTSSRFSIKTDSIPV